MENSRLENKANDIHGIIDDLIAEVDGLESDKNGLIEDLKLANERIEEMEDQIYGLTAQLKSIN